MKTKESERDMKRKILKNVKGITIVSLIVTIVVITVVVSIGIASSIGDNKLVDRTVNAKVQYEIGEFKEKAETLYLKPDVYEDDNPLEKLAEDLNKRGYEMKTVVFSREEITGIELSSTEEEINIGGEPVIVKVKVLTNEEERKKTYVVIDGDYYEVTISENEKIEVSNVPSKIEKSNKINMPKITAIPNDNNIKVSVKDQDITIQSNSTANIGTSTITVKADGENFENNIVTVSLKKLLKLDSINVSSLVLDGACLITATLKDGNIATSNDVIWKTSDSDVATVTSNGIVKCGTKAGTATIICMGSDPKDTKSCEVTSTTTGAKIVYTNMTNANTTVSGETTGFSYNNPVIPVGFSAIDTKDAKWNLEDSNKLPEYNNGLVIMDKKGNQFVWVPVDGSMIEYKKWCTTNINYNFCSDDKDLGPIYENSQISDYHGFWIGRYEAGLDVDLGSLAQTDTSNRNITTGSPIIVEGAIPWNYIDYTNSRQNAIDLVTKQNYNNKYVVTGLVTGAQWDTTLNWLKKVGNFNVGDTSTSESWGNYKTASLDLDNYKTYSTYDGEWSYSDSKAENDYKIIRTGSSNNTKAFNIYDLAGNLSEWTSEWYVQRQTSMNRGGGYNSSSDLYLRASVRAPNTIETTSNSIGYRIALYVHEPN